MTKVVFFYKKDGQITNPKVLKEAFDSLKDGKYELKIKSMTRKTLPQNGLYWLLLDDYIQAFLYECGYASITNKDKAHDFCVQNWGVDEEVINEKTGEVKYIKKAYRNYTKEDSSIYIDTLYREFAEAGLVLPDPQKQFEFFN